MVDVCLVDFGVLELDGVGEEAAEAAAPLDYSGDGHTEHQVVGLDIVLLGLAELLEVLEVPRGLAPWKGPAEKPTRPLEIQRFIEGVIDHADEYDL